MRTHSIIIGFALLAVTFTVVWILLQPAPTPTIETGAGHPADRDAPAAHKTDPAPSEAAPLKTDRPDDTSTDQAGDTQSVGREGEPSRAETTTVSASTPQSNRRTQPATQEDTSDEAAEPRKPADFITGHDRPRGQTRGATRPCRTRQPRG